jgi:hypothetical protein
LPRHGENEDIEQAFIAKLSDSESEAAETQVWFDFAARCNYMKL